MLWQNQGQNLTGVLPEEFANLTFSTDMVLEDNQLQGSIPPALGNLINLRRFLVSANNLSGELPDSLGKLTNITFARKCIQSGYLYDYNRLLVTGHGLIDGNPISGKIPSFIGNWTKLDRLRVSDWKGGDGKFPPLQNMKSMQYLVLRNLSISGELPDFIEEMTALYVLDLSFNNLTGSIPKSFDGLQNSIGFMFLTNNMLSGTIPSWILSSSKSIDLSYNSFTGFPTPVGCQQGNVFLLVGIWFLVIRHQTIIHYYFFINCGGPKVIVDDNEYEDDTLQQGPSTYAVSVSQKWAYSSTGDFLDNDKAKYIARNVSELNMTKPELYMTARLNPLSLKYYGLCLQKGSYKVNLHFAEIMYTNDQTYFSVGERLFDASIQGKNVMQDFNIAKVANGTGKEIIRSFNATVDGTLEIHFQWAGKGTNAIPQRGVYGPLISAIAVTPKGRMLRTMVKLLSSVYLIVLLKLS
ncbi:putative LRR receptor-like serine/threonine-protein kinase [Cocos nucifera]|uniref:non-specific serine/threonine protein kinase n=1 Tax=Cocos nucifera TaxID=13894 RepID=A0A8K0IAN7_COCNU|nr:putative LRR receptor-like serine/threonine-protein kinase [Cocos nucifera]